MNSVLAPALRTLAERFSLDRDEWRQLHKGGDMMLDGLLAHGYAIQKAGRFAVSEAGRRMLDELVPVEEA